jgi:hypothetical protein
MKSSDPSCGGKRQGQKKHLTVYDGHGELD